MATTDALVLLAGVMLACSSAPAKPPQPDPRDARIAQQQARIERLEQDLSAARRSQEALRARAELAETRLGLRPFRPKGVRAAERGLRFEAQKHTVLEAPGARGRKVDLRKHGAAYRAYVIAFWATWCKPCTNPEEIAALGRLKADLERMGSTLVGVAVDGLKKVKGHPRAGEWFYPVWQRDDAHIDSLPKRFIDEVGLGLPLFVVVSGDGELLYWRTKPLDAQSHEDLLTAAIAPPPGR